MVQTKLFFKSVTKFLDISEKPFFLHILSDQQQTIFNRVNQDQERCNRRLN